MPSPRGWTHPRCVDSLAGRCHAWAYRRGELGASRARSRGRSRAPHQCCTFATRVGTVQPDEQPKPAEQIPDLLRKPSPPPPPDEPEVGEFRPGTPFSQAALAGYLVGRVVTESLGMALYVGAAGVLVLAAVAEWVLHWTVVAVLLVIFAVIVLLMRAALLAVIRRLTGFSRYGPLEERVRALVSDTRSDVLRELRRVGLPGRMWTLPALPMRLVGSRRADTLARLRKFRPANAVPQSRVDELHLVLSQAVNGGMPPGNR
jgi:hypothetical protein